VTAEAIVLIVSAVSTRLSDARDQLAWEVARTMPGVSLVVLDG